MTNTLILVPFQMLIAEIRGSRGDVSFRRTLRGWKGVYHFYIDVLFQGIRCSVLLNDVCVCNEADFINPKEVADFLKQHFLADFTKETPMPTDYDDALEQDKSLARLKDAEVFVALNSALDAKRKGATAHSDIPEGLKEDFIPEDYLQDAPPLEQITAATLEDQAIAFAQRAWSEGFTLAEAKLALSPGLSSAQYIQVAESFTASCINYLGVQLEFNKPVKGK